VGRRLLEPHQRRTHPGTYEYIVDGLGYFTIGSNWNAAEAMQAIALDFGGEAYFTLRRGYGTLPQRLQAAVADLAGKETVMTDTRLATFKVRDDVIDLTFKVKDQVTPLEVQAKHLFLAMPRRSLEVGVHGVSWS
jgi:hypothetical protein